MGFILCASAIDFIQFENLISLMNMLYLFSIYLGNYFLFLFPDTTANLLTSGPYGLIFASFIPFYLDIPVSTRFRVFGVNFSDKSFIYLAGVQVIIYHRFNCMILVA